ncbi:MAG: hypothetical protein COB09_07915 [Thalassobium sp.]|nr:MAG: hypothetical protein COB09_07915 [Thalassobium sp.]
MTDLKSRYDLVCSAISPVNNPSQRYLAFKTLLNDSLLPFINRVNVVVNEAEQMMKIRAVDDELRMADSLAAFSERTIVAVAGGFSSGKSSLITSLFADNDVRLPIGIEPVTAIPTYVFHADNVAVRGYPQGGGFFDVPIGIYERLSHKFVEEFGFNLRDLLPFMSLEVPMKDLRNISFIDLPGYNPGDRGGSTGGDQAASDEFIAQGQALIWVIGLDSNGTVPRDDLDKLWSLSELNIPLYVVLNKADLRPQAGVDEVLDQIAEELMLNGIPYEGISAYSSARGSELAFRERSLMEVLSEWDRPRNALDLVVEKLSLVLDDYQQALEQDVKNRKAKASLLKALELNLLEIGAFETDISTAEFDVEKYMSEPVDKKEQSSAAMIIQQGILGALLGSMRSVNATSVTAVAEGANDSDMALSAEVDGLNTRADQVNQIRDQLQGLRQDYCTDQSNKHLEELAKIKRGLNSWRVKKAV